MEDFRLKVKESANYFKKNWIEFAKILNKVQAEKLYLQWGYKSIVEYAKKELKIKKETVFKLISSYSYLISENLETLSESDLPSIDSLHSLNKIKTKILEENNNKFPEDKKNIYEKIKNEVIKKDLSPSTIYKRFGELSSESDENFEQEEIKKLKFHIKRAYNIISKIELPQNINNSFTEIMEYINNL